MTINAIQLSFVLNIVNGGFVVPWSENDAYTQNNLGASAGIVNTTTSMSSLPLGSVSTLGYCVLKNLDVTNNVQWGLDVSGSFVSVGTLKPGELAFLRFTPGVVPALEASAGTPQVQYLLVND